MNPEYQHPQPPDTSGNPDANFPMEMQSIPPPEGTQLFEVPTPEAGSDKIQLGLSGMKYGKVETHEVPGEQHLVEGTVLRYEPGPIEIRLDHRNPTAEEINELGRLALRLSECGMILEYIPKVLEQAHNLHQNLEILPQLSAGDSQAEDNIKHRGIDLLANVGVILKQLEASQITLRAEWQDLVSKFGDRGVILIEGKHSSGGFGQGVPVKLALKKYK